MTVHTIFPIDSQKRSGAMQRRLAYWNQRRLAPQFPDSALADMEEDTIMRGIELAFLEDLRASVAAEAAEAPEDAMGFVDWFESLKDWGPGQGDPLFPWLAEHASREDICWFLEQEAAGEAGFDDLVALTQVKLPVQAKLELARNFWDEMGRGSERGMHGPMLASLTEVLDLESAIENTVCESLALANAMTAMATNRHFAWHSVGALGVIELTAPSRSSHTAAALKRIGLSREERLYFDLHAVLDIKHSTDWNREALAPLIEEDSRRARAIAEGALMRLTCGEMCFERYRRELWSSDVIAKA